MRRSVIFLRKSVFCLLFAVAVMQPVCAQVYAVSEKQVAELEAISREREEQLKNLKEQLKETEKSLRKSEANHLKTDIKVGIVSFSVGAAIGAFGAIYIYNKIK